MFLALMAAAEEEEEEVRAMEVVLKIRSYRTGMVGTNFLIQCQKLLEQFLHDRFLPRVSTPAFRGAWVSSTKDDDERSSEPMHKRC